MAIKPLNSVAGFSIGEFPTTTVIDANGNISANNLTVGGVSNLGPIANVLITGGVAGQVISTDGAGNLSFITVSTAGLSNGTSNIAILNNGNITFSSAGNANVVVVTGTGVNVAGTLNTGTGNANVGNLAATQLFASANVTAPQFISNVATGTAPFVVSSTTKVANLNADTLDGYDTATANTANTVAVRDASGNLSANFFIGNGSQLTGLPSGTSIANGNSNVNIPDANGNVNISAVGNANVVVVTGTGANIAGTLNVTGNANVGNIGATRGVFTNIAGEGGNISNIQGGNVSGAVASATNAAAVLNNVITTGTVYPTFISSTANGNYALTSNTVYTANIANGFLGATLIGGTLTTAAQPNITSVGTLTSLSVTGTATAGNLSTGGTLSVTGNANVGNLGTAGLITATGNVSGGNLTTGGIVNATGNIVSSANVVTDLIVGRTSSVTITATGTNQNINLVPTGTGVVNVGNFIIANVQTPVADYDAATKKYVDDVAQGLNIHDSVQAATPNTLAVVTGGTITYNNGSSGVGANLTTTGSFNLIDGVNVQTAGTRILVKNEANAVYNGIYVWSNATVITRAADYNSVPEVEAGDFVFCTGGTLYDNTGWVQTSTVTAIGTAGNNIDFTQFSGAGTYSAGTGLQLDGSVFSIANTTVTPGSYGNGDRVATFTVNQQGQLSAASNVAITANAANLTGTTLNSTIVNSSLTSVGTLTSLTVTGTASAGNLSTGGTLSVTGNANVGNLGTGGLITATGNVSGGNLTTGGVVAATGNVSGGNLTTGGALSVTGNANVGNIGTAQVLATANVTAPQLISNVSTGTAPLVVASTTLVANLNADLLDGYNTATANTANTVAVRDTNGNISANYFIGNGSQLTGLNTDRISNGTSNVSIPAANGNVNIVAAGNTTMVVTGTGANITGTANVSGNLAAGNISATNGNLATANISGNILLGNASVTTTVTWGSTTTTSITANQTIASFSVTGITGVEFLVKSIDASGSKYSVSTVQAVTDGTSVDYTTFGGVNLGGFTGALAVNISGGQIRLQTTPASSNSTVWTTQYRLI